MYSKGIMVTTEPGTSIGVAGDGGVGIVSEASRPQRPIQPQAETSAAPPPAPLEIPKIGTDLDVAWKAAEGLVAQAHGLDMTTLRQGVGPGIKTSIEAQRDAIRAQLEQTQGGPVDDHALIEELNKKIQDEVERQAEETFNQKVQQLEGQNPTLAKALRMRRDAENIEAEIKKIPADSPNRDALIAQEQRHMQELNYPQDAIGPIITELTRLQGDTNNPQAEEARKKLADLQSHVQIQNGAYTFKAPEVQAQQETQQEQQDTEPKIQPEKNQEVRERVAIEAARIVLKLRREQAGTDPKTGGDYQFITVAYWSDKLDAAIKEDEPQHIRDGLTAMVSESVVALGQSSHFQGKPEVAQAVKSLEGTNKHYESEAANPIRHMIAEEIRKIPGLKPDEQAHLLNILPHADVSKLTLIMSTMQEALNYDAEHPAQQGQRSRIDRMITTFSNTQLGNGRYLISGDESFLLSALYHHRRLEGTQGLGQRILQQTLNIGTTSELNDISAYLINNADRISQFIENKPSFKETPEWKEWLESYKRLVSISDEQKAQFQKDKRNMGPWIIGMAMILPMLQGLFDFSGDEQGGGGRGGGH